jgi:hypothetical protein
MKTQYAQCVLPDMTEFKLNKVYQIREQPNPNLQYVDVLLNGRWEGGYWRSRFVVIDQAPRIPKPPKSKYVQLRLKRNTTYWVCGEDGQPNAATQAEMKRQADAIIQFLHRKVPSLIVSEVKRRMLVS